MLCARVLTALDALEMFRDESDDDDEVNVYNLLCINDILVYDWNIFSWLLSSDGVTCRSMWVFLVNTE